MKSFRGQRVPGLGISQPILHLLAEDCICHHPIISSLIYRLHIHEIATIRETKLVRGTKNTQTNQMLLSLSLPLYRSALPPSLPLLFIVVVIGGDDGGRGGYG